MYVHTPLGPVHPNYKPLMNTEDKLDHAHRAMVDLAEAGYRPVMASVTGSRLRGLDRPDSDTDLQVVVHNSATEMKHLGHTTGYKRSFTPGPGVEGQMTTLDEFMGTHHASVPYTEVLHSPFAVTDPNYTALFGALTTCRVVLEMHAARFAVHALSRVAQGPRKAANTVFAAVTLPSTLNPTLDRDDLVCGSPAMQAAAEKAEAVFTYYLDNPSERRLTKQSRVNVDNAREVLARMRGD